MVRKVEKPKKSYRKLTPLGISKWGKGLIVEGTFLEIRESPNTRFEGKGHILDLDTEFGKVSYGCPTILYNYLQQVDRGEEVRITCLGKIKVPRGKAWDFDVEVVENNAEDDTTQDKEQ
jgi:hypothetical protein